MPAPVRVSAVSFVNARPLVHGLEQLPALFDVRFDLPAACAERLHRGEVDLGLVPAIEYLRDEYRLVPGMAIGSDGPVLSVAIFTTRPVASIRRVAVDASSRTSVALARIICAKLWDIEPPFVVAPPDLGAMLAVADAALVIGDPALDIDVMANGVEKLDLGEAWRTLTGLPFVYAAWTGRPGVLTREHVAALDAVKDAGLAARADIAREYAQAHGTSAPTIERYLRDNLSYTFGPREQAGLERFFTLAVEVGHVPQSRPLRFY